MYKGFKDKRAYHNKKIYALAIVISGEDNARDFIEGEVLRVLESRTGTSPMFTDDVKPSIKSLTDNEASMMYNRLIESARAIKTNQKKVDELFGTGSGMTDAQRKKIIKVARWEFKWDIQVTFSKIIEILPELRKRLTPWEIQNCKMVALYGAMNKKQADKVIKVLSAIEKRNLERA